MDGKFEFCGKQFQYPEDITNSRVVAIYKLDNTGTPWWVEPETLTKTMRLMLDGPHDEIDWAEASFVMCLEVYRGFFPYYISKTNVSGN